MQNHDACIACEAVLTTVSGYRTSYRLLKLGSWRLTVKLRLFRSETLVGASWQSSGERSWAVLYTHAKMPGLGMKISHGYAQSMRVKVNRCAQIQTTDSRRYRPTYQGITSLDSFTPIHVEA